MIVFISRSQGDVVAEFRKWSDESAIEFPVGEDRTRQEFKESSDVNVILRQYAAGGFEPRPVMYGAQETDFDLQTAFLAAEVAEDAWQRLPDRLRGRYPGWPELLAALEKGEASLVDKDGVVVTPPTVPPVVPVSP